MIYHDADRDLLRSIVMRDAQVSRPSMEKLGRRRVFLLLLAGTAVAAERRFGRRIDDAALHRFVQEMEIRFAATTHPIDPEVARAVLGAALGRPDLLSEVDDRAMTTTMVLMTHTIINDLQPTQAQIEDFCGDAIALADTLTPAAIPHQR